MGKSLRCLFDSDFKTFLTKEKESIFGVLCDNYHGDALTTTREAWSKEIEILQEILTCDGNQTLLQGLPMKKFLHYCQKDSSQVMLQSLPLPLSKIPVQLSPHKKNVHSACLACDVLRL